jgi:hypothetical protein
MLRDVANHLSDPAENQTPGRGVPDVDAGPAQNYCSEVSLRRFEETQDSANICHRETEMFEVL